MGWFVKPSPALDFIHKLGHDKEAMEAFKADPEGELSKAGLTDEEKAVVRTQDKEHLMKSILGRVSEDG